MKISMEDKKSSQIKVINKINTLMSIKWSSVYVLLLCLVFSSALFFEVTYRRTVQVQKNAYRGNQKSQVLLGNIYYEKKKYKKALFWYQKANINNSFISQNKIIDMYLKINNKNKVFKKDVIYKLIERYQKWAKAGDIEAQKQLITLSCHKLFPENDYIRALYKKWQNTAYMVSDCILYKNNLEIRKDNEKIINLFNKLALKSKDIGFKYELWSRVYTEEQKRKYNKSIFETAVLNEYPPALLLYIDILLHPYIIYYKQYYNLSIFNIEQKKRKEKAIQTFEKLNQRNWNSITSFLSAKYDFAYIYDDNYDLEKNDFKEAIKWYKKAYTLGESKATYEIGMLYKEGDKTLKQNYSKAFEWFYKSAIQNHMSAQIEVGDMYMNSLGVEKNLIEAIKWYKRASKHNSFFCSECYKTDLMLNKLGLIDFLKNIRYIYETQTNI